MKPSKWASYGDFLEWENCIAVPSLDQEKYQPLRADSSPGPNDDFAHPPHQIDGRYERLLAVRDLASGYPLLWLPDADESAMSAVAALKSREIRNP